MNTEPQSKETALLTRIWVQWADLKYQAGKPDTQEQFRKMDALMVEIGETLGWKLNPEWESVPPYNHRIVSLGEMKRYSNVTVLTKDACPLPEECNGDGYVIAWNDDKKWWEYKAYYDFQSHSLWTDEQRVEIVRKWPYWRTYLQA